MKTSDWDDPTIRAIGRRYAAEAYDLASELHNYGADAAALLKPHDPMRPRDVCLPAMLADVVMAVLLTLPGLGPGSTPRGELHSAKEALGVTELKRGGGRYIVTSSLAPASPHYTPSRCGPRNP